jgi:heme exporter protein C
MLLGFVVPPIGDGLGGVLQTRQIAYFHVPMAVAMETAFLLAAACGVAWLITRSERADAYSVAYAEIGAVFGIIATLSGAIFAKHNWGLYWSWDPQQTGILVTLLTYAALFALRGAAEDEDMRRNLWSVYAVVGLMTALFSTVILRRVLPTNASLHPKNTLLTSDALNKFALWFNVFGYIYLLVIVADLRARLEIARERVKELTWDN